MALEKIVIGEMGSILERALSRYDMFSDYTLDTCNVQNVNSPTKIIEYSFIYTSKKNNRWLLLRIQDFYTNQKLIIWINKLNDKENLNLDIQSFFIYELKNKAIKNKLTFKLKTKAELERTLVDIFKYLTENSNRQFEEIIGGKTWVNLPFDWGNYK